MYRLPHSRRCALLAAALSALSSFAFGQYDPRALDATVEFKDAAELEEHWIQIEDGAASLTWTFGTLNPAGGVDAFDDLTYALPFDRVGSILQLDDVSILVSGFNSTTQTGHLLRLLLIPSPRMIIPLAQQTQAGLDPFRMAWNQTEGRLYVWDWLSQDLLATALPYPASGPPNLASLQTVLTDAQVPALGRKDEYDLYAFRSQDGVLLHPTELGQRMGTDSSPRVTVQEVQGVWTTQSGSIYDFTTLASLGYAIRHANAASVAGPLQVKGPGGPLDVVDIETSQTVHTTSLADVANWWQTDDSDLTTWQGLTFPSGTLVAGRGYKLVSHDANVPESRVFWPLLRYGQPSSAAGWTTTWSLLPGQLNGWDAHIGNADFHVRCGLLASNYVYTESPAAGYLAVGLAPGAGPFPVAPIGPGGAWILTQSIATLGPQTVDFLGTRATGFLLFDMPLPNDPNLVGLTALFQYGVAVENQLLLSDVFGTQLLPAQ